MQIKLLQGDKVKYVSFLALVLCSCAPQLALNELPMYGNEAKTSEMKAADDRFIEACRRDFPSLDSASRAFSLRGWDFFKVGQISNAMKRFNQAWLLDSTNYKAYWGMGLIVSVRDRNDSLSAELLEQAVSLEAKDCELWHDYGVSYLSYYENSRDEKSKSKAQEAFKQCIDLGCDDERTSRCKTHLMMLKW